MKAKNLIKTSLFAGICALAMGFANSASAATQTWNGPSGGTGTWNTANTNWDSGVAWSPGNTAVFGGSAGTVTISTSQTVGGLQFNTDGYTLAGGGLSVGNGIAINVSTGTTTFSAASQVSLTGNSGVPIAMSKTGAGTLSLLGAVGSTLGGTGANAAAWTISGGTLEISGGNQLGTNPAGAVMAKLNGGTLRLLGNSVAARWLQVDANGGTLEATQGVWAGNIANNADSSHTFNVAAATAATGAAVISGVISGTGSLTMIQVGSKPVQLTGANTYTGATTISGGTLSVGTIGDGGVSSGNLGSATSAASNLVFNNGTLQYTGATASTNRNFTIAAGSTGVFEITANTLTLSGASVATTGALTKAGAGTLILSGANNHSGVTTISAGILSLANASALQNSALDTTNSIVGNATNGLQTTATTLTIGGLAGNKDFSTVFTTTAGGYSNVNALTLNPQTGVSNSYSGIIANGAAAMTLTKNGNATQTLSGANTYSGLTTVSVGTLLVSNTTGSGTGTGSVSVASGAILGGTGTIAPGTGNSISVSGQVAPGAAGSIGTLTINSLSTASTAATFASGATFAFDLNTTGLQSDKLSLINGAAGDFQFNSNNIAFTVSGTLASGQTYTIFTADVASAYGGLTFTGSKVTAGLSISGLGGAYDTNSYIAKSGNDLVLNVVPEPTTWALLAGSLTVVTVFRRRRS